MGVYASKFCIDTEFKGPCGLPQGNVQMDLNISPETGRGGLDGGQGSVIKRY